MIETTFHKNEKIKQWFWHSQSENGEIVADGGQGYASLPEAINGFMAQQGYSGWEPDDPLPEGYTGILVNPNEFTIEKETR